MTLKMKKRKKKNGFALVWTSFLQFTMCRANVPFPGHLSNSGSLARTGLNKPYHGVSTVDTPWVSILDTP